MIISIVACIILAWTALTLFFWSPELAAAVGCRHIWFDLLAGVLFLAALYPSCTFEEGRREYKASDRR